jgi:hypothetical protein
MRPVGTVNSQALKTGYKKMMSTDDRSICRVDVGHARAASKPSSWRGAAVLCLWSLVACAGTSAHSATPATAGRCPAGTYNYGDGMVASLLPDEAEKALVQAHATAMQEAGPLRSSFLAGQPWRPHVSVIYGVTDDRAAPAYQALEAFLPHRKSTSACFGGLQYWDDDKGGKTTLVVDVIEPAGLLSDLHNSLAEAAHIASRFAYQPHVTLLYLQERARLSAVQEAAVLTHLRNVCWPNGAFYLTDPCGQEVYRAQVPADE